MEPFGRRIAKQRAELGWTQARLAERIAVSRVALSHLEAGMSVANERTVALLAATFGLEAHDLIAGTDYPRAKAERLPLVVARHTEVDLQLALLGADLRWIDALAASGAAQRLAEETIAGWCRRLDELIEQVVDPEERRRVVEQRRALNARR